jgi:hypothetical protein
MAVIWGAIGTLGDFTQFPDFSGLLTSFAIDKPTNVVSGDYVLLRVNTKQPAGSTSVVTPPAGFTLIANNFTSDAEFRAHMWLGYRKIDGSEGATFSFSWAAGAGTQAANDIFATCQRIQGVDGTTFLGSNVATFNDDATASPVNLQITTTVANAIAVWCYASRGTMATQDANYPSGTTGQYVRDNGGGGFSIGQAVETIASASATGNRTWTNCLSGSPYWATVAFAVKPAAAASTHAGPLVDGALIKNLVDGALIA